MNQIFGYQILPEGISSDDNVFEGTQLVLPSTSSNSNHGRVRVFTQPHSCLQSCFSQEYKSYSYVWGIPAHPEVATKDIPEWCSKVVAEKCYGRFRELIGTFVIIIDEPGQHRITFVTDILGVRPMFIGKRNGHIVFGSEVWPIYKAGLSTGAIDYDAVSAWITYGYNCTDGSLFSDLRRLPPASAVIIQDDQYTEIPYAELQPKSLTPNAEQVIDDIHNIVLSVTKTLLTRRNRVSIALSGGYDSRYLLALSSSLKKTSIECMTVSCAEEEDIANQVAETLGVPLKKHHVNGSTWNMYDEVFHFTADGFPISKFVTYCIAEQYPEIPMVNGFNGDSLIRATKDTFLGKYETEWDGDLAHVLQRIHLIADFGIFHKEIAKRIQRRSLIPMEEAVQKGARIGKVFAWTHFFYRARYYISNNFLQHIGITEALLPFYSWELFSYKMEHDNKLFNRDVYQRIFQTYFPELAKIPHASDLHTKRRRHVGSPRCVKQWARQLFPVMCKKNWLSLLMKKRCIPLDIASIAGSRRAESTIFLLERLYLLEKSVKDADLDFDWECI